MREESKFANLFIFTAGQIKCLVDALKCQIDVRKRMQKMCQTGSNVLLGFHDQLLRMDYLTRRASMLYLV